jgi:pseudouridine synthase
MQKERLQKILSQFGICSRRQAEEFILSGKVKVNDKIAKLGDKADLQTDKITINNKVVETSHGASKFVYYLVNKPAGYLCSNRRHKKSDKLVIDLVPKEPRVWSVGRLDKESTGLIILTNDGEFTQKYTYPKFEHEKEYEIEVDKKITQDFLQHMKTGIELSEGIAKADEILKISENKFKIILHQGWNRQIRRMCHKLGYEVLELKRLRIGKIELGNLSEGKYKIIEKIK